jgi:hypothetical protein
MKKIPVTRLRKPKAASRTPVESWHGGGDIEIRHYARSLQKAAKTLVGKLERDQSARTDLGAGPVVLLYRQALEIHLKLLVGEGGNFLRSPIDHITLSKTQSLRWLAQIVCQIIRKVGWESEFKCEGVSSLVEFSALVNEVEIFDPVSRAVRHSRTGDPHSISQYFRTFDIFQFAKSLDALLTLLDSTADALAAESDQRTNFSGWDFGQTVQ